MNQTDKAPGDYTEAAMNKILVFDFYPAIRQLLTEDLAAAGNVTLSVEKPGALKEAVERFSPDVVVLDLYDRGVMHWDLLEDLKARYPTIPVLLFTAFILNESPRLKKADGWVQKSYQFEELMGKISALLLKRNNPPNAGTPPLAKDSNQIGLSGASMASVPPTTH
jgi:CheY-like chemotaxis protein